ncbi:MAG: GDP-L-fucose synthase [Desulfobacterales bacterium]|nr:GDP-L-fucose synthase [Desulfobacterales bacterium]
MKKDAKIYVAGHTGMVGSAIVRCLKAEGYNNIITRTHVELDLERQAEVEALFHKEHPDYVFLAAAKVGGIHANNTYPAEFIYNNLVIQTNVLHAAWKVAVKRLLFLGSSCIYPRECPQPMKEEYLLTGLLEPTNEPYAVAKIAGIKLCESYNRQYGTKYRSVMPTNLYGPKDNFDLKTSHVLPAVIRKIHLAKLAVRGDWKGIQKDEEKHGPIPDDIIANLAAISQFNGRDIPNSFRSALNSVHFAGVALWGSGRVRREFLHVDDLADACLFVMNLPDEKLDAVLSTDFSGNLIPFVNVGTGTDVTIKELAEIIKEIVGFEGGITYNTAMPDGTPQKLLDVTRINNLGWHARISLKQGIESTYEYYLK